MAVNEQNVLLQTKGTNGSSTLLYPITKADNVDGLEEGISSQITEHNASNTAHEDIRGDISDLNTAVAGKANASHMHDDRYYTESEIDSKLSGKSDTSHTHDDRYYTESEIDSKLSGKSDTGHTHSAYVNQNAFSKVTVGSTTIAADAPTDTLTLAAGSNITLTPDASGDKITIAATNTTYTHPNSGVSAGTYKSVTVNAQGHVTAGSNPTTLSGYGITDAATKTELGGKSDTNHTHTASDVGALPDTTVLADLTQDSTHRTVTDTEKATWNAKSNFSGSYNDLTNKPTIPSIAGLATETYVDTAVANIVDSSPDTLNTLNELAAALGDDPNFATTVATQIGNIDTKVDELSENLTSHTHNYAGSSSAGGAATSANKLNTNAGSATQPVYFANGIPVKTTYTLGASVPSGAKFTDTVYTHPTTSGNKHIPSGGSSGQILRWSANGTAVWGADNDTTYSVATQSEDGLMSAADKTKLDGIATGAAGITVDSAMSSTSTNPVQNKVVNAAITEVSDSISSLAEVMVTELGNKADTLHIHEEYANQNAFSNVKIGTTTIAADSTTDTLTLVAGSNVTLTPSATSDSITIAATNTVYTHPSYTSRTSGLYKITVNSTGHVSAATAATKSDITALGIPAQDTTYSTATTSAAGLMSAAMVTTLNEVESRPEVMVVNVTLDSVGENYTADKTFSEIHAAVTAGNVVFCRLYGITDILLYGYNTTEVCFSTIMGNGKDLTLTQVIITSSAVTVTNSPIDVSSVGDYMTKADPVGEGSLSMNRLADSTLGAYSTTLGYNCTASGLHSFAAGATSVAAGSQSIALGSACAARGSVAVAMGAGNEAAGNMSFAMGQHTRALQDQFSLGHYNNSALAAAGTGTGTTGTAFCVGNGTSSAASNALRITYTGQTIAKAAYSTGGADYAEYFEWGDGNVENEDRVGYFVTFDNGRLIRKANADDYILGIVSANPSVLGNHDECWMGRNEMDEWGRFIRVTETAVDEITGETYEYETYKVNPEYDDTIEYIPRSERSEWDAIGLMGMLSVRDDGTCQVNGYCKVADGGIATASDTGYRVIERVADNIVKVVLK